MLLTELFTQPVDYQITHSDSHSVTGSFEINDNQYGLEAYAEELFELDKLVQEEVKKHVPDARNVWQFEFALEKFRQVGFGDKMKTRSHNITGTGNAATIFATALEFIKDVINKHNIQVFIIDADAKEPSRVKLYKRMVNVLANKVGWNVTVLHVNEYYTHIIYKEQ